MQISELVLKAQQGDRGALGSLFQEYWWAARAAAYGVTGDLDLAEDAAAEGFQAVLTDLERLRDPARFGPWLRTIVVRKARRLKARAGGTRPEDLRRMPHPGPDPSQAVERAQVAHALRRAVAALTPALRESVSLFYLEGYDLERAARFLEVPVGTLKRRLHDARRKLRRAAEEIRAGTGGPDPAEQALQHLGASLAGDDDQSLFTAFREALALRPAPLERLQSILWRPEASAPSHTQLLLPSERVGDPSHPVGRIAGAIRSALPEFQEWPLDLDCLDRPQLPGPGSFMRATRGLVVAGGVYQAVQSSRSPEELGRRMAGAALSDVVDLYWQKDRPLLLSEVEEWLRNLAGAVLPAATLSFEARDEPRYRAALSLSLGNREAAVAGVLASWPGLAEHGDAAHARLYLEPWASACTGHLVEPVPLLPRP